MALVLRWTVLGLSLAVTVLAGWLFAMFAMPDGWSVTDWLRLLLSSVCVFWLAWGGFGGMLGLFARDAKSDAEAASGVAKARTAILIPIYNEDPPATFARAAAMGNALAAHGVDEQFNIFLLSDTNAIEVAARETVWFERLLAECAMREQIFYRRRDKNVGRKAGNIEEFIRRSGGAFDYALVLDADSLMEPKTIVAMVERMQASPRLGLLQTLPSIVHARSLFGRVMQFAGAFYTPVHARGAALLQGNEGPFWGHNAMFRVTAFAQCCGLPELPGKPPFGGHILSHDFVEAALLTRGGWQVLLAPEFTGSYEEGPENLIDYAKRDRRWCQGNLQHHKVLLAAGLHLWNRMTLLQGIMAYLLSPIWLALLLVSVLAGEWTARVFYRTGGAWAGWSLIALIATILLLPKVLIVIRGALDGRNRRFGGTPAVAASALGEIVFSSLLAPMMLLFQARSVIQVLLGLDGGWPASNRDDGRLGYGQAIAAGGWIAMIGAVGFAVVVATAPVLAGWSLVVLLPMVVAPLLIAWSSRAVPATSWLWQTPEEIEPAPIMREWRRIHDAWSGNEAEIYGPEWPFGLGAAADARG